MSAYRIAPNWVLSVWTTPPGVCRASDWARLGTMRTNAGNLCRLVSPLVALCSSWAFIPGNNFKYLSSEAELCFQSNAGQPGRPRSGGFSEADRFPFTRTAGRGALRRGAPAPLRAAGAAVRLALFGLLGAPGAAPLPGSSTKRWGFSDRSLLTETNMLFTFSKANKYLGRCGEGFVAWVKFWHCWKNGCFSLAPERPEYYYYLGLFKGKHPLVEMQQKALTCWRLLRLPKGARYASSHGARAGGSLEICWAQAGPNPSKHFWQIFV